MISQIAKLAHQNTHQGTTMSLITTPVKRKPALTLWATVRLSKKQAKAFTDLGGASWVRDQLDVILAGEKSL